MGNLTGNDVWTLYEYCKDAINKHSGEVTSCASIGNEALSRFMNENDMQCIKTEKMVKYIHGSGDSTDNDVIYVVDKLPSLQDCKRFCSNQDNPNENRNICVIYGGEVVQCYKGTPDEVNNAVYLTYKLHKQEYPLLITHLVPRDLTAKCMRAVRIILSHLSRSQYRAEVKHALVSDWETRLKTLEDINLETIDFEHLNNNMTREDILKTIAFQIGQTTQLCAHQELYTKAEIAENFGLLEEFLYRDPNSNIHYLENCKKYFLQCIRGLIKSNGNFITDGVTEWDVTSEKKIIDKTPFEVMNMYDRLYKFMNFLSKCPDRSTVEMEQDMYDFCMEHIPDFIGENGIINFNGKKYFLG